MGDRDRRDAPPNLNLLRKLWIARRIVGAAVLLGILFWFVAINSQEIPVHLPFGLGSPKATVAVVVLWSAVAGSLVTMLLTAVVWALRRRRTRPIAPPGERGARSTDPLDEDRPPSDYAARTPDGFPDSRWDAR